MNSRSEIKRQAALHRPSGKEKTWAVEIPDLHLFTQGDSQKDALEMAKDAVETAVGVEGFSVSVTLVTEDSFAIHATEPSQLFAFMLKQQRAAMGLSVREVAKRMGSDSPTAYSRYEKGKTVPSLDKIEEIAHAINPRAETVIGWFVAPPEVARRK